VISHSFCGVMFLHDSCCYPVTVMCWFFLVQMCMHIGPFCCVSGTYFVAVTVVCSLSFCAWSFVLSGSNVLYYSFLLSSWFSCIFFSVLSCTHFIDAVVVSYPWVEYLV
jgi:hypothetical protein